MRRSRIWDGSDKFPIDVSDGVEGDLVLESGLRSVFSFQKEGKELESIDLLESAVRWVMMDWEDRESILIDKRPTPVLLKAALERVGAKSVTVTGLIIKGGQKKFGLGKM